MRRFVSCAMAVTLVGVLAGCTANTGSEASAPASTSQASTTEQTSATQQSSARPEDNPASLLPAYAYALEGSHEVNGRQGVAAEGDRIWVSGSTTLSCYDANWNLLVTNDAPFDQLGESTANHIGDIDVWQGEVYVGLEQFEDGVASNIQIAVYDGETLALKRTYGIEPTSGQDECSGICVDAQAGVVWLCSWTGTGRYLYGYDLASHVYKGRVQLHASPQWIQGVACHDGNLYLTADDGDADFDEPDHVYRTTVPEGATHATVALERTLDDVTRQGEIEGLTFTDDGRLLVLYNRGARIVLGMPTGFYDGYDREIHEVFAYRMSERI